MKYKKYVYALRPLLAFIEDKILYYENLASEMEDDRKKIGVPLMKCF